MDTGSVLEKKEAGRPQTLSENKTVQVTYSRSLKKPIRKASIYALTDNTLKYS